MDSGELIELFYNRTYEKYVNKQILDDKNYIVPRQQLTNYVHELVNIPYIEFVEYLKLHDYERNIEESDLTLFSSFPACEIEMCNALIWSNNPGCQYLDIGRYFPDKFYAKNVYSYITFGENQIKTSTQLGLTFEYYNYWYLSCLGYIFPDLEEDDRKKLLSRTITRNRLYKNLIIDILHHDITLDEYVNILPDGSKKKKILRSISVLIDICLSECWKGNIKTHKLKRSSDYTKVPNDIRIPYDINSGLFNFLNEFNYRILSQEETEDLIIRYRKKEESALDTLIKGHFQLIIMVAKLYRHKGCDLEDLIQEGSIGLIKAINNYKIYYHADFRRYARWWIEQTIKNALNIIPMIVRLPYNYVSVHSKMWRYIESREQIDGFYPSVDEIANHEFLSMELVKYLYQLPSELRYLTTLVDDLDTYESNVNQNDDFEDEDYKTCKVNSLLNSSMTNREEKIIRMFYGIGVPSESLEEIGDKCNLTRERVRQIKEGVIKKLREYPKKKIKSTLKEEDTSKRYINSFRDASIGAYIKVPQLDKTGIVIGIQKSANSITQYVLLMEDGSIYNFSSEGLPIVSSRRKDIKKARTSPEREAFLKRMNVQNNIDYSKIYNIFDNYTTSYKFLWFISILSLARQNNRRTIVFKDICIRMIAIAWPLVSIKGYSFGDIDQIPLLVNIIRQRMGIKKETRSGDVEVILMKNYYSQGIYKILNQLLLNVPYRLLSPWIPFTNNIDVIKKSNSNESECLYAFNNKYLVINKDWWQYIKDHYEELYGFSKRSLKEYLEKYNFKVDVQI